MQRHEKTLRNEGRFVSYEKESPSFSSSLLEKIYRSIDDDAEKRTGDELKLFKETMAKKTQSKGNGNRGFGRKEEVEEELEDDEETASLRRACLIEKWMDRKTGENAVAAQRRRQYRQNSESVRKYNDSNNEAIFFSSTSSSSDSSSGGFSSSDTESMFGTAKPIPPVRTAVAEKKPARATGNRSCYRPHGGECDDEALTKSKSRALKIYDNLKKVKQPISPGGKLASFLNSLFKNGGAKSAIATTAAPSFREIPSSATCSSASSFSRSCLSKNSPSTRERLRNFAGAPQRSVRFYPVSVIVDEDSQPCGHRSLREDSRKVPTNVRSTAAKAEDLSLRFRSGNGSETTAREFLRAYKQNQLKNEQMISRDKFGAKEEIVKLKLNRSVARDEEEPEEENYDDSASCSSSDLFELDHLAVRYQEELPVYETTRVHRNRAIF